MVPEPSGEMQEPLLTHLKQRHLNGQIAGLCAVCSSHPMVLAAAMEAARQTRNMLLVEATPNQVNLDGGYAGLTPKAFGAFIRSRARKHLVSEEHLVLGADHLGPHLWKSEKAAVALQKTAALAQACVEAGYHKFHLDTAVSCADDDGPELEPEKVAQRAVMLCQTVEDAARQRSAMEKPVYVIGNEVPPPGGHLEENQSLKITDPSVLAGILDLYRHHFVKAGLEAAWQRVIAVVVQPGIEFGDRRIAIYQRDAAAPLAAFHAQLPPEMTYEVHSADYQPGLSVRQLFEDHFCILKIGPCLTFALRKVLFALADLAAVWPEAALTCNLRKVMETLMQEQPRFWRSQYRGTSDEQKDLRENSYRDRIRYYWNHPQAVRAVEALLSQLNRPLPQKLVDRFLPEAATDPDHRAACADSRTMVQHYLRQAIKPYFEACGPSWNPTRKEKHKQSF
jgi:D-tagatose-1,6-bisphosphate aldolase subunit GatZ/KbaZ